jgi:sensor histidine kinase YesM
VFKIIKHYKAYNLLICNFLKQILVFAKYHTVIRILSHCLFWLGFLFFYASIKPDFVDSKSFIFVYSWKILAQAIGAYVLIYFIIPKTLNKKRYLFFCFFSFAWLYLVFSFLMVLKFYYLEPKFPVVFEYWLGHNMSIQERLTSFKLIFGEFSFITYPTIIMGFIRFYKDQQRLSKIEEEKKSMELKILKNQLNPHFLFNTLNNLYALTLKKDDNAPKVISKLSEILDFVLFRCNEDFVSIENEIKLLKNYIALEKLRYDENRLEISFLHNVNNTTKISPLILLTFVENAFKHSVINETGKAKINIVLKTENNQVIFIVQNTKPQNELTKAIDFQKIGLENVRKQLELLYPKKHILSIDEDNRNFSLELTLNV